MSCAGTPKQKRSKEIMRTSYLKRLCTASVCSSQLPVQMLSTHLRYVPVPSVQQKFFLFTVCETNTYMFI